MPLNPQSIPALTLDSAEWERPSDAITASFDIRHSGYKIAPVDANLFPAGWHQICDTSIPLASGRIQSWLNEHGCDSGTLILLAESFTRNAPYLENIAALRRILTDAGYEIHIAMMLEALPQEGYTFNTTRGPLWVRNLGQQDGTPVLGNEVVDAPIMLATDLAQGPGVLDAITSPIYHDPSLGWHKRTKDSFFAQYNQVATDWAHSIGLDPWHVTVQTEVFAAPDLRDDQAWNQLIEHTSAMLEELKQQYDERSIDDQPFVVIKAAAGTFGRGVIMISDAQDLAQLPAKAKKNFIKQTPLHNGVQSLLVQEGIYTRDFVDECPSEPVLYCIGGAVVGGFYRSHCGKDPSTNLNAPGMVFAAMCADDNLDNPAHQANDNNLVRLQGMYYAIGYQALVAIDQEIHALGSGN